MARHGITAETPNNILLGAGTIHRGLTQTTGTWNFETTIIGATSGGSSVSIVPEYYHAEVDGAWVRTKGLTQKVGEVATMEVNFIELSPDVIQLALGGEINTDNPVTGYTDVVSKALIEAGDYVEGLAFVGQTIDGRDVIILFENALCTSGFELSSANKEAGTATLTFEAYADITDDLRKLPVHVYYPTV